MLKQLQKVFISIRDQTFFQRTLSDHFFEDLKSKSKQDNILNFLERIIYCYNKKITFVELKCK